MAEKYDVGNLEIQINAVSGKAVNSLSAVRQELEKISTLMKGISKVNTKNLDFINSSNGIAKRNRNFGMNLGKLSLMVYFTRRLAHATSKIVNAGSNYTETLNMWQVAMRNNLGLADEFVKKMNKAYGISTETLMRTQAIFKNMIGSLGQISDQVAYQISESFTQMALDFSSLYNVTFESAIKKFQAVLAGQVRPIRSVSGYDITETTLFGLYQQLGGQKSMRQLNRTEKQLLSILAVFNQMEASGAIGDLSKTLGTFANQSRMVAENWKEFITWVGIGLKMLIEQSGLLKNVNALLMVSAEISKSIVYAMGYEVPDFLKDIFESNKGLEETNNQLDKIKGKLLGFDKFRALQGQEDKDLPIDEILLKALEDYKSVLANTSNEARNLAENILTLLGFVKGEDGIYEMSDGLNSLVVSIGNFIKSLKPLMQPLLTLLKSSLQILIPILDIINLLFGSTLQGVTIFLNDIAPLLNLIAKSLGSIVVAIADVLTFNWNSISDHLGMLWGVRSARGYANGGVPDKGSLFIAGESGAELVGDMGNGNTGVMNMAQMENAVARGMVKALARQTKQGETINISIDGNQVFKVVKDTAKRQGLGFSKV